MNAGRASHRVRDMAVQGELFAWSCQHIEPAGDIPAVCSEVGTDRAEYEHHMRTHGLKPLKTAFSPIKLRKTAPAAKLAKPIVNPFKWLNWAENGTERKGQYWSDGPDPQSVWVVPLQPGIVGDAWQACQAGTALQPR